MTGYDIYANSALRGQRRRQRRSPTPTTSRPRATVVVLRPGQGRRGQPVAPTATPSPAPAPAAAARTWPSASRSPPPSLVFTFVADQRQRQQRRPPTGRAPAARTRARSPSQLGANADRQLGRASSSTRTRPGARARRPSRCSAASRARPAFTNLSSARGVHLQPGHRQHGDDPGHRARSPTSGSVHRQHRRARPARSPSSRSSAPRRRTRTSPSPACRGPRPRRSRPTRSRCPPRCATPARRPPARRTSTSTWARPGRHRHGRRARGRRVRHRLGATSAPRNAGTLPAERQGRRGQHRHRAERGQQHLHQPDARWWSAPVRQLRPGRRAVSWTPSNPAAGNSRHLLAWRSRNQGTRGLGERRARHHADRPQRQRGTVVTTLTGSYSGAIAAGRHHRPGQPGHLDGGQRQVHRPRGRSPTTPTSCRSSRPTTPATQPFFVGRGANMPYDMYEAEDGVARRRRGASSARTARSATWPARRPAAGRSR